MNPWSGYLKNNRPNSQSGFSLPDAIMAILITGILISSSLLVLVILPGQIDRRLEKERDRWRFLLLWQATRDVMDEIQPGWWSDGVVIEEGDTFIRIKASRLENSPYAELSVDSENTVFLATNDKAVPFDFIEAPVWTTKKDNSNNTTGIVLEHPSGLSVLISAGARELRVRNHNDD